MVTPIRMIIIAKNLSIELLRLKVPNPTVVIVWTLQKTEAMCLSAIDSSSKLFFISQLWFPASN